MGAIDIRSGIERADSIEVVAPTGGVVGGAMGAHGSLIGVYWQDAAAAAKVTFVYRAPNIVVPKLTGAITQGAKVYYDAAQKKVTTTASGNTLAGRCVKAAGSSDTTVQIDLTGNLAA